MDILREAATSVRAGQPIAMAHIMDVIGRATAQLQGRPLLERVDGETLVVGPLRGHGCDFAHYLLTQILPDVGRTANLVLLGNYIDGAHQSVEVLYLVSLLILHAPLRVIPLLGRHELLYPLQPDNFGCLRNELRLRALHTGDPVAQYEKTVRAFFACLAVGCVVQGRFFCVPGGPASGFRYLAQIEASGTTQQALHEFILNEQMDEDEERIAGGSAFVAAQNGMAFRFTFNAVCNFISRNRLAGLVVGMEYHTNRPEYDSFARPNHYKESIYFPGFMLGRTHPETQMPAVLTLFSAPCFCGVNRNNACLLRIRDNLLEICELRVCPQRPLIMPGRQNHAFSWALPALVKAIKTIAREMISGTIVEDDTAEKAELYKAQERIARAKMRRMCRLLQMHDLPLPEIPHWPAEEPTDNTS